MPKAWVLNLYPIHEKEDSTAFDRKSPENSRDAVEMLLPAVEMLPPGLTPRNSPCAGEPRGAAHCKH